MAPSYSTSAGQRTGLWTAALALVLLGALPYFTGFLNANERPRLLQARALVESGSLAIDEGASGGQATGPDVSRGKGGLLYPNKAPGTSLVVAGAYVGVRAVTTRPSRILYTQAARLLGAWLPTVLLAWGLFRRYRTRSGRAATIAIVLGTPLFSYAHVLFGHSLAAMLLWFGAAALIDARDRDRAWMWAMWGGIVAGCAVAVEYTAAFAGVPLGVFVVARYRTCPAVIVAAICGALVPIGLLLSYHDHAFGSPWTSPYHAVVDPSFAAIHQRGLLGLTWPTGHSLFEHLISPWGGAVYWAPLVIPSLFGFALAWRLKALSAFDALSAMIFLTVFAATMGLQQAGGWRVGPRYLVCALPFLVPGLIHTIAALKFQPVGLGALIGLVGWSLGINGLAANLFPHLIPAGNPLFDQLLPLLGAGAQAYGWPWLLGMPAYGTTVAVLSAFGLGALAFARCASGPHVRTTWITAAAVATLLLGLASLIPASATAEADRAALESIWEPRTSG